MAPTQWQPNRLTSARPGAGPAAKPPMATAIGRGLLGRCPSCGKSHLFNGYLRVVANCAHCDAPLGLARADDAPPYFTIFLVGHIVIPLMMYIDRVKEPSTLMMAAIFLPMTLILSLVLLRPIKGGTVGLMVNLNMLKNPTGA